MAIAPDFCVNIMIIDIVCDDFFFFSRTYRSCFAYVKMQNLNIKVM